VINRGETVVFRADRKDGVQGVYAGRDGSIQTVVETGDAFETLALFPSVNDNGTVAFAATLRAGGTGIFTAHEGRITPLSDPDGPFEAYRGALINDADVVVFIAAPSGGSTGLFAARTRRQTGFWLPETHCSTPPSRSSRRTRCR
jgi:hypothetical protein